MTYNNILDENRFFSPEPETRKLAVYYYNSVKDLPIVSPHGHVNPKILAENTPFPNPAELFIIPDHYVFRMLYSQGIPLERLGVPTIDGSWFETDPRKIWKLFAENFYLFLGTPTGIWLTHELYQIFGITERPNADNAEEIYDIIRNKLLQPDFLPRNLYERMNIEILSTTDAASDSLDYHKMIRNSDWDGRVIPAFRPDAVFNIAGENWLTEIEKLSDISGIEISDYNSFIQAIKNRREYFKSLGAVSTDQGILTPYTHELSKSERENIFSKALKNKTDKNDQAAFTANMIMEMAEMSIDDGLVMQLHPGSFRNHNNFVSAKFGSDKGCDIPISADYTNGLRELLNKYGNNPKLSLIVFTLDESAYSRELAPLAGHYPAMKLGPAWWFNDSIQGMNRYRKSVTETAGFYNTVGFNDDTRAFLSIPARHDVARRVDSNFLAELTAAHQITKREGEILIKELSYDLVKKAYRL